MPHPRCQSPRMKLHIFQLKQTARLRYVREKWYHHFLYSFKRLWLRAMSRSIYFRINQYAHAAHAFKPNMPIELRLKAISAIWIVIILADSQLMELIAIWFLNFYSPNWFSANGFAMDFDREPISDGRCSGMASTWMFHRVVKSTAFYY